MAEYLRVRDRSTGHEYTIRERQFDADAHERLDSDPLGLDGLPRPPKYRVKLGETPAPSAQRSVPRTRRSPVAPRPVPVTPDPDADEGDPETDDGQSAESDKEND